MQEKELGNSLERFSQTFKNWDSNKCPVARCELLESFILLLHVSFQATSWEYKVSKSCETEG